MAANAVTKFIAALQSLVRQGLSKQAAEQFAKNEFGEISKFLQKRIDDVYKNPKGEGIENIKIKDEVFDDTVVTLPIDDTGVPFNPNNPLKQYGKPKKSIKERMDTINETSKKLDDILKEREKMFKPKKTDDFNLSEDNPLGDLEKIIKGEGDTGLPKKMSDVEEAIDNASPGFAGDRKYDAQLVADDLAEKRFGKDFYDLDQKQQMDLYDEAYQGLTKQKFDPPEDMATGGRAGYGIGSFVQRKGNSNQNQNMPAVDARMKNSYDYNVRRNNAERTINQMSRNYDFSGLSSLGLNPKTYDSTPGPMRGIPAVEGIREKMIQDIMSRTQSGYTPPPKPIPKTYRNVSPEAQVLNMSQSTYDDIISSGKDPKQYYMDYQNRMMAGNPNLLKYGQVISGPGMSIAGPGTAPGATPPTQAQMNQMMQNNPMGYMDFDDLVKQYSSTDPYMNFQEEIKDMVDGRDTGYMSAQDYYDINVLGLDGQGIAEKYGLEYAKGGRAGYYTGGMVDVEPSLSDIGHGSDALMARTRLVSPGSQSTTSTGLNYLLAEDNDNIRVPFAGGGSDRMMSDAEKEERAYNLMRDAMDREKFLKRRREEMEIDKKRLEEKRYGIAVAEGGRIGFANGNGVADEDAEKAALGKRVRELMDDGFDFGEAVKQAMSEGYAEGGRIGFSKGKGVDLLRRGFLKTIGAAGAGIAALKTGLLGLGGKGATKQAAKEIITTPAAAGKPAWFDSLVTRVINEGEDVTKKFATKDREIVHATKIDDDAMVTVYRDLDDGTVRVDIDDATTNVMGEQGDSVVSMEVRGGQLEEGVKGKTPVEFEAREADYRNYMDGPDDFTTETIDNVVSDTKDLTADLTKVKMYAKGQKKPTIREMMIQKDRAKTLKQAEEYPAEYASDRGPDIDTKDYDYASGGIARMIGE